MLCSNSPESAPTTFPREQAHCWGFHRFSHVKANLNLPQAATNARTLRNDLMNPGDDSRLQGLGTKDQGPTCSRRP